MLVGLLGAGGMGEVYRAFDPELARQVAIKVMRDRASEGQARLLREAQAMAKLAHPNVVAVFDVGTVHDRVFLAMELIDGGTLRQWLAETTRTWREVVRHYLDAGRGLAAAHRVGIVHRDFKPDNVVVDTGGRVCVTDFGLAFGATEPSADGTDQPAPGNLLGVHVTRHGAVIGTPGYLAPEVADGAVADPRADQYSFCAALFEALYGALPTGAEPPAVPANRSTPAWLLPIVSRGLSPRPGDRYPSMDALLADLALDRTARRRRRLISASVAASLLVAGGVGVGVSRELGTRAPTRACQGARQRLDGVWDRAVRARLAEVLAASGLPYQAETLATVTRNLDAHAADWVAMRTEACEATQVRRDQDEATLELRNACLDQRRDELAAFVNAATTADKTAIEHLAAASERLSRLAPCADRAALRAVTVPAAPTSTADLAQLRADVAQAHVDVLLGRYREGRAHADATVAHARALGARALEAEALLMQGLLALGGASKDAARAGLLAALMTAEATRHDDVAFEAALRLALVVGILEARPDDAEPWLALAAAVEERMGHPAALAGSRLSVAGIIARGRGDLTAAVQLHRDALALTQRAVGPDHLDVGRRLGDLGATLIEAGATVEGTQCLERSLAISRARQGATHPDVVIHLSNLAAAYTRLGNAARAIELAGEVLSARERILGANSPLLIVPLNNLASALVEEGRGDDALAPARRAVELATAAHGADSMPTIVASITLGDAEVVAGHLADADARLADALTRAARLGPESWIVAGVLEAQARLRERQGQFADARTLAGKAVQLRDRTAPADSPDLVPALLSLGRARLALGQLDDAIASFERALAIRTASAAPPSRAETQFALAQALAVDGRDLARARSLARTAEAALRTLPRPPPRVDAITAWLAAHPDSAAAGPP